MEQYAKLVKNTLDTTEVVGDELRVAFHANEKDLSWQSPTVTVYLRNGYALIARSSCLSTGWLEQCDAYTRCAEFVRSTGLPTS